MESSRGPGEGKKKALILHKIAFLGFIDNENAYISPVFTY